MKVILASGQSAGVVFDGPPTVDDIKRLIAALELQRSFIAGDPINLDVKFSSDVPTRSFREPFCLLCGELNEHDNHAPPFEPSIMKGRHEFRSNANPPRK